MKTNPQPPVLVSPETPQDPMPQIAVGQVWRAPDHRLLRVVGIEAKQIAVRNVETNRLNYQPLSYFDPAQKWHLVLQPAVSPPEDAAPPVDLEAIKKREAAATKGDMKLTRYDHGGGRLAQFIPRPERSFGAEDRKLIADFYDEANREFYVQARQDIPILVAEVERLRALHAPSVLAAPDGRLRALKGKQEPLFTHLGWLLAKVMKDEQYPEARGIWERWCDYSDGQA